MCLLKAQNESPGPGRPTGVVFSDRLTTQRRFWKPFSFVCGKALRAGPSVLPRPSPLRQEPVRRHSRLSAARWRQTRSCGEEEPDPASESEETEEGELDEYAARWRKTCSVPECLLVDADGNRPTRPRPAQTGQPSRMGTFFAPKSASAPTRLAPSGPNSRPGPSPAPPTRQPRKPGHPAHQPPEPPSAAA